MSNLQKFFPALPDSHQSGNNVFENLFVYGKFYVDGDAFFGHDTEIEKASIKDLIVTNTFGVGIGSTVFFVDAKNSRVGLYETNPVEKFHASLGSGEDVQDIVINGTGIVGLGTTNPLGPLGRGSSVDLTIDPNETRLDIAVSNSIAIGKNLYDSTGYPGINGSFLQRDAFGLRWVTFEPGFTEGIQIQNEGASIPSAGAAKTYSTLNFTQLNSLGVGTDTSNAFDSGNSALGFVADIQTFDLWGYNGVGAAATIYRMTKVGIGTSVTHSDSVLDVIGNVIASNDDRTKIAGITTDGGIELIRPNNPYIDFRTTSNTHDARIQLADDGTGLGFVVGGEGSTSEKFTISGLGSVGINKTVPLEFVHIFPPSPPTNVVRDIVVTSSGSIGIGTTNPEQYLHINTTSGGGVVIKTDTKTGIGTTDPQQFVSIKPPSGIGVYVTDDNSVGIGTTDPTRTLDVVGDVKISTDLYVGGISTLTDAVYADSTVDIDGITTINSNQESDNTDNGALHVDGGVGIKKNLNVAGIASIYNVTQSDNLSSGALKVAGGVAINKQLNVSGITSIYDNTNSTSTGTGALKVKGGVGIGSDVFIGGKIDVAQTANIQSTEDSTTTSSGALVVAGGAGIGSNVYIGENLDVAKRVDVNSTQDSTGTSSGALVVDGGVGIAKTLNVGGKAKIVNDLELDSALIDTNNSDGGTKDYRLASVGTGVSWRPSGVETENIIWVSVDGDDANSGLLEGDAKRHIGAAAAIAQEGDTIIVRSGVYEENNPIGLRSDVSVHGQDLRLVTVVPENPQWDVFYVRRGCLIENLNFAGETHSTICSGAAVAFPPTTGHTGSETFARSGYTEDGPVTPGPSGRWRSPYIRNCTNFMTGSTGMKINGDFADAPEPGQDLKSMVCDSFTQYNENGIGVSVTNSAYAQLVSIFTINCDIAIYAASGGQCDLTNSNSSFGNFGLYADGTGDDEYVGVVTGFVNNLDQQTLTATSTPAVSTVPADTDRIVFNNFSGKPYDGQGLFFKIDLGDYNDIPPGKSGIVTEPLRTIREVRVTNGGSGYSPTNPPVVTVDIPGGPEGILAELSANVSADGVIESVTIISSGSNFLPDGTGTNEQQIQVGFQGAGVGAVAEVVTDPILFTVNKATDPTETSSSGLSTVTFNEFIPYPISLGTTAVLRRLSRIITSSHSFEYVGAGTDINRANPFQGGEPIPENEIVQINGAQIPFTSTDQKGNFRIGQGLTIDQTTSTISGRDFNRAIQANLTPLILGLGG